MSKNTFWCVLSSLLVLASLQGAGRAQEKYWDAAIESGENALNQRRYAEAEEKFITALKMAERFGEQDPRLGVTLNDMATLYYLQGKYDQAELTFKHCLTLREKVEGPDSPDLAITLRNFSELYKAQRKYDLAKAALERALKPSAPRQGDE